jgi:hypothetical protein
VKIAYLLYWNDFGVSGVWRKVQAQCSYWTSAGHTVTLFIATKGEAPTHLGCAGVNCRIAPFKGMIGRVLAFRQLCRDIARAKYDVVYHRYETPELPVVALRGVVPLVLEINTDDVAEAQFQTRRHRLYRAVARKAVLKSADGVAFVTNELAAAHVFGVVQGKRIVISNGVDGRIEQRSNRVGSQTACAVFVGTPSMSWQGIEDVECLASRMPEVHFHIVGYNANRSARPTSSNLSYHGFIEPDKYSDLLSASWVGIGTLGLYRKGMEEACPLKVREYLAYRLPVVVGYKDSDFQGSEQFVLRVPNEAGGVLTRVPEIRAFIMHWGGKRVPASDIAHMAQSVKEANRLAFLEQIALQAQATGCTCQGRS